MKELRFDGRAVVVTGAARGIGRCHAQLLAARGAQVVVADYGGELDGSGASGEPARQVAKEIVEAGGSAVACYASVAEEDGAASIIETALEHFGRIDAVLNNAGISDKHLFRDLSTEQFHRMLAVHYLGTLYVCKAAWPHFSSAGYGRIVNTVSEGMLGAQPELTSYGGAKGGVWALTRTLAAEGAPLGIRVNAVAPRALTRLSLDGAKNSEGEPQVSDMLARMDPALVSPVAAFLAHESCELDGEALIAGGGQVMRLCPLVTTGITKEGLSIEDVAGNLDAILDTSDARVAPVGRYA